MKNAILKKYKEDKIAEIEYARDQQLQNIDNELLSEKQIDEIEETIVLPFKSLCESGNIRFVENQVDGINMMINQTQIGVNLICDIAEVSIWSTDRYAKNWNWVGYKTQEWHKNEKASPIHNIINTLVSIGENAKNFAHGKDKEDCYWSYLGNRFQEISKTNIKSGMNGFYEGGMAVRS